MSVEVRGIYADNTDEIHIITDDPEHNGEYIVHKFYVGNRGRDLFPCGQDRISSNQACNLTCDGQTLEEGYTAEKNRESFG